MPSAEGGGPTEEQPFSAITIAGNHMGESNKTGEIRIIAAPFSFLAACRIIAQCTNPQHGLSLKYVEKLSDGYIRTIGALLHLPRSR